jgi:prevent-host-death family protein
MAVMRVSSSEFRVKMKDLANSIAEEQHRVVVTRHGGRMMVVVSQEDFEFLEKHKPQKTPRPVPDPVPDVTEGMNDPDEMEDAEIERVLAATEGYDDDDRIERWRRRARLTLGARRHFARVRGQPGSLPG